jgi:hypothetical protein
VSSKPGSIHPLSRWAVIENGYDDENFRDAEHGLSVQSLGQQGHVALIQSGVLYPQERDPGHFFRAARTEGML